MKSISVKLGLLCAVLFAGASQLLGADGFVVIANESVTATNISMSQLKSIYTGKTKYWESGEAVVIAVVEDKTDGVLNEVTGMDAGQFRTFWKRLVFSGRGQEPKYRNDVDAIVSLVASTKGAIAIVPAEAELKGVKKLEIR